MSPHSFGLVGPQSSVFNISNQFETAAQPRGVEIAIGVEKAVASYGKTKILDGLSMRVEKGAVYALLGPSGCGKTTLLSCILGRKSLESGIISVFGGTPGDRSIGLPGPLVGFMPQDICLFMQFTVKETFQYFGRLQKMNMETLEKKQIVLLDMLDLPEPSRSVSGLSGGQKRRLSFAVALLHNPKLLILDEPTVGVDPLVRARIWSHLKSLSQSGVTIIITTHYVEEARDANTVGIMRNGRLLAQESPRTLMEKHQAQTLEKVFLCLCQDLEQSQYDETRMNVKTQSLQSVSVGQNESVQSSNVNLLQKKKKEKKNVSLTLPSLSNTAALCMKNWITMKRNFLLLLFVFFLPGLILLINCITIGHSPINLPIGLVNYESDCSENYYISNCEANLLGCYFKQSLNKSETVNLISYTNESEAIRDTEAALLRGMIVIPEHFSTSVLKRILSDWRFDHFIYYYGVEDKDVGKFDKISLSLDASDPQLALFVTKAVTEALDSFTKEVSELCKEDLGDIIDLSILSVGDPLLGDEDTDFREFITPGITALTIFFLAMALTSESFIAERSQGLLERSWIIGVLPVEILASYMLSQFVVLVVQAAITIITVFAVFQIPSHGPIAWIAVLTVFQGLAGMSFGFFLSTICNTSMDAIKMAIGACLPHMLLTGIIWPLEGMPPWMRSLVWYLPHTASVRGMRDIMLRGWGVEASSVLQGMAISSAWILLFLFLSWKLVRNKIN
eukprot:TRINITY_DN16497_c0_g1_i1.p1 TRINITY_DN16497_c0_g1~~TRINITY_DN16497_c0_g1_i1.p1  ORF type:complete len:734 (+),score=117.42 TRINITY_DN16497_c0_g1_i1:53-2254(+)